MAHIALRVLQGPAAGSDIPVDGALVVGRAATGDGALGGDDLLSRRHAEIAVDGPLLRVTDLGSTNGTFVGERRIDGPTTIAVGERLRVGGTTVEVVLVGAPDDAAPTDVRLRPAAPDPAPAPRAEPAVAAAAPAPPIPAPPPPDAPARVAAVAPGAAAPVARASGGTPPASADLPSGSAREHGAASIVVDGRRIPLPDGGYVVGRDPAADLVLSDDRTSRRHARIDRDAGGGWYVVDLGSSNGTLLDGERLHGESRWLDNGDTVQIGGSTLRFLTEGAAPQHSVVIADAPRQSVLLATRISIGRDPAGTIVLDDPNVSRNHAEVALQGGTYVLRDLGSRNGTRVNGEPVTEVALREGDEIGIGPFRFVFDGNTLVARDDRGSLHLDAEGLGMEVPGKRILEPVTLQIRPGELFAIIGESGAGKSTLLKALAGVTDPTEGAVLVNGEPIAGRVAEIGYVPQDEIVSPLLTVRESLEYAARLRLPEDSSPAEITAAVDGVIAELALEKHADTRVAALSGGQRKRAGVGVELVNSPGLLFLDEATTGLDPGLERRMMELMRSLADRGRAVITITHATKNLNLCDRVAIMGRGGVLCFIGAPADALRFFGVEEADGIYDALDTTPAREWADRFQALRARGQVEAAPAPVPRRQATARRPRALQPQLRVLVERYSTIFRRDKRALMIQLAQVPILAVFVAALAGGDVFATDRPEGGDPGMTNTLFFLAFLPVFFGVASGAREIIKERAAFVRETAVGVRIDAYLLSKGIVLGALAAVQATVLVVIVLAVRQLHGGIEQYLGLWLLLVGVGWAGVALGLLVSSLSTSENQATSLIPLVLVPQLIFGGAIRPFGQLPDPMQWIAAIVPARWGFAGAGGTIDADGRLGAVPAVVDPNTGVQRPSEGFASLQRFGEDFFSLAWPVSMLIMGAFVIGFGFITHRALTRRSR
ncbi:MAG: FHA domain-containing protein [Solirubrobacteraceae bacterium]|nr:FHA domain-containing protein [Solirubrobacteraceae bacterium]